MSGGFKQDLQYSRVAPTVKSIGSLLPYVRSVEDLAAEALSGEIISRSSAGVAAVLDGQPRAALSEFVSLSERRTVGAFFTGAKLRDQMVKTWRFRENNRLLLLDPACGAGDLLIACAQRLPVGNDLASTLRLWGSRLYGCDISPEFVRITRARLAILAAHRSISRDKTHVPPLEATFPNIAVGDGLGHDRYLSKPTHVVLNPPFSRVIADEHCRWAGGRVSMAAVFLDRCVSSVHHGTRIAAILPDVLRSGSSYSKWRSEVESKATIDTVDVYGPFDSSADVDVFVLRLTVGPSERTASGWRRQESSTEKRVGDYFDVHVGAVVPYRDPKLGPWRRFINARILPPWSTFALVAASSRRHRGRTFTPPFVAVRRTSAPSEKRRAVATIVVGDEPVSVENHLIVLKPRTGGVSTCHKLLKILEDNKTTEWLNERIRCRHLTVSSLKELPWLD